MSANFTDAADERIAGGDVAAHNQAAMLDVNQVAGMLNCSSRHVYRLSDMGRMPRPVKLGALVRWSRSSIEGWIAEGCPNCRKGGVR